VRRLFACVAVALAAGAQSASASTLSIAGQDTTTNSFVVEYSGMADRAALINFYGEKNGTSCATEPEQSARSGFVVQATVPAGPFSGKTREDGGSRTGPGRYLLCAYLSGTGPSYPGEPDPRAMAQGTLTYSVNTGVKLETFLGTDLDYSNPEALAYAIRCNAVTEDGGSFGCRGDNRPDGTVTVTIAEADRKRLKLPARRLMQTDVEPNGSASDYGANLKLSSLERRRIKAAHDRADRVGKRVVLDAVVVYRAARPLTRTVTQRVTLVTAGRSEIVTSCVSTTKSLPCPSRRRR
jgi:hypothetical protein